MIREESAAAVTSAMKNFVAEVTYNKQQTAYLLSMSVRTLERKMVDRLIGFIADGDLVLFRKAHLDDYAARHEIQVDYRRLADFPLKKAS